MVDRLIGAGREHVVVFETGRSEDDLEEWMFVVYFLGTYIFK
jgi:hypothetical protein